MKAWIKNLLATATITATMMGPSAALLIAHADVRVQTGVLDCNLGPSASAIIASSRNIACRFTDTEGRYSEIYRGSFERVGLDLGATSGGDMVWMVFAPTNQMTRGALAGDYVGLSGEASLGQGLGANALVGGFDQSIALQPISIQSQRGINLALGVGVLTLNPSSY